jgi:preprotein translocase subunit SecG
MLIEVFMTFHVILCFALIVIIYFAKPDSSGLSSFVFKADNQSAIRFRPVTKLIFVMVIIFFANSLFLNKLINERSKESSIVNKIEHSQNDKSKNSIEKNDIFEKIEKEKK